MHMVATIPRVNLEALNFISYAHRMQELRPTLDATILPALCVDS